MKSVVGGRSRELWSRVASLPNIKKNVAIWAGLCVLGRARHIDGIREIGPAPLDFFNHSGNILSSMNVALAASAAVYLHSRSNEDIGRGGLRRRMIVASVASGLMVNAVVETKFGLGLPVVTNMFGAEQGLENTPVMGTAFTESTPDPVDFAYGVVAAAAGGVMAGSVLPEKTSAEFTAISVVNQ